MALCRLVVMVMVRRRRTSATVLSRTPNSAIPSPSPGGIADDGAAPVSGTGGVGAEATSIVTDAVSLAGFGSS